MSRLGSQRVQRTSLCFHFSQSEYTAQLLMREGLKKHCFYSKLCIEKFDVYKPFTIKFQNLGLIGANGLWIIWHLLPHKQEVEREVKS